MVRSQGRHFSDDELKCIIMLLRESELSLPEIADRMNCSRSAVAVINRKFQIRLYGGRRSHWNVNRQPVFEPVSSGSNPLFSAKLFRADSV